MSDEFDFEAALDTDMDDIAEPLPFPKGTYVFTVGANREFGKSKVKETPFVQFELEDPIPQDDVDMGAWEVCAHSRGDDIHLKNNDTKFYLTQKALWGIKGFLRDCGLGVEGRKIREVLEETPGCQIKATLAIEVSDRGRSFNIIEGWHSV